MVISAIRASVVNGIAKAMAKRQPDPEHFNWLTASDEGKPVLVTGHYNGDFTGTVKYGGREVAVITDANATDHEICYMYPVQFIKLDAAQTAVPLPDDDNDIPF